VFYNSTKGIINLINQFDIQDESYIFCGEDSVVKCLEYDVDTVTDDYAERKLERYNFFTSRYFSAFDIELPYKADVVMLTDIHFADHSILDPGIEIIQIAGRFRNGLNSLTHITTYDENVKFRDADACKIYLEGCFDTYNGFVNDYNKASNPGKRDTLYKAINDSDAHKYYQYGKVNQFMVDNYIHEEMVKGYYKDQASLKQAYELKPKHFNITYENKTYCISDHELFEFYSLPTKKEKEKRKAVAEILYRFKPNPKDIVHLDAAGILKMTRVLDKLRKKYPEVALGVHYLDKEAFDQTDCVISKINEQVAKTKERLEIERVSKFVYALVDAHMTYQSDDIRKYITQSYADAKTDLKSKISSVLLFFDGSRTTQKKKNVYVLKDRLYPIQKS
jgi:hypothetical protein